MNQSTKKVLKKFSATTIETINRLSPEELETHGIIQSARVSGHICPICGSGDGSHGTGMVHNKKIETHTSFTCFSGSHSFNVLKLCALHYNLDTRNDFQQIVEKICADFDIPIEYDEFSLTSGKRSSKKISKPKELISPDELKLIQQDLAGDPNDLWDHFMKYQPDHKWRGFDFDFLKAHGCRHIPQWTPPKSRLSNQVSVPSPRMLVPVGDSSYLARLTVSPKMFDEKTRKIVVEKQHAGHKKLFGADVLTCAEPIFCFEGYFDAMSAELAGFKAVALGGCGEGDLLCNAIDLLKSKPQIIILFDPDKAGSDAASSLREELLRIKCPCVIRFLSKPTNKTVNCNLDCASGSAVLSVPDKVDANSILQKYGVDVLRGILQEVLDNSFAELYVVETLLAKRDDASLSNDDWDFIFSGDPSDLDFARRLERFCGKNVRWLTDSEHWLIYKNGLWLPASERNSAVSPLARQLSDSMIQNAQTKSERDLADKFKSSKKIGAAITLLKSCDSILITAKDLDNHNELFCVRNGVVNLQTGELFPLDPKFLITQQSPAIYRPGYRNPTVDNFLTSILPDIDTLAALIRFLGYAATGEVSEEKALFFYGGGGNGKGTLTRTLIILFGSYATTLKTAAVLLTGRNQDAGAATTELNPLENIRIAIVEELPQGGRLDVAKFKNLIGSDFIPIRKLHQEQIYIEPHFSPILSGNYRPELSDTRDPGLLRRLMNIDFVQSFIGSQRDPYLKRKLAEPDALSGFLSLIVDNAILWYRDGLLESSAMKQATHDFLHENDFIGEFIEEHCQRDTNLSIPRKAFIERLKKEYPAECLRQFNNRDRALVDAIRRIDGISYRRGAGGGYQFFGIGWRNATA